MHFSSLSFLALASAAQAFEPVLPRQSSGNCQQDLAEIALYAKNVVSYAQQLADYAGQFAAQQPMNGSVSASSHANSTAATSSAAAAASSATKPSTLSTVVSSASAASATAPTTSGASATPSAPATSSAAAASGAASSNSSTPAGSGAITSTYTLYKGDGSTSAGWPDQSKWIKDFETMWSGNVKTLGQSCSQFGAENNSDAENKDMHDAILSVASTANLDPRFVLAIIVQESGGCVRVWATTSPDGTVVNPGIMQDHNGAGSCNKNAGQKTDKSLMQTPCPQAEIEQMIKDGTLGTKAGDGLQQTYGKSTGKDAQKYYQAARMYNSGTTNFADLGDGHGATNCYASDVANRLVGFVGTTTCTQTSVNYL